MAARIVHFGADNCCRLLVLEHAGYDIDHCPSVVKLSFALTTGREADAVFITEDPKEPRREAIALVRSRSSAPLILFQTTGSGYDEVDFDLVIPVLTPTHEWLEKIAAIIERSRAVIADSISVSEQSAALRQEAMAAKLKSVFERERSVRQRSRINELTRQHLQKTCRLISARLRSKPHQLARQKKKRLRTETLLINAVLCLYSRLSCWDSQDIPLISDAVQHPLPLPTGTWFGKIPDSSGR